MQRAKFRRYLLVVLAILAVASMFSSLGGGGSSPHSANPQEPKQRSVATKTRPQIRASFGFIP